ncbi:teichoic acid transport system ATP-binding protein [Gracilibacillus orientalis]|uniref:Teichoic acid transport system ATP-binding protein n=1 Tax=Gracilibacillus orientalis TaxID=334253 RepID=A0A1I4PIF8_9BACI|nr:ATP-binding cassette domain-containing protein [Gracilibacillus orientalis]SFM27336.1 teichoic acid transport system ATP-binding protein [Gracilibacillus orientalis]
MYTTSEEQATQHQNEKEIVIKAEDLGVAFNANYKRDDYKSIAIKYLSKKEKKKQASKQTWPLRNINFTGYKGEVLGIVGSNGSGKTTLCKALTGILHADEGNLKVNGKVSALFSLGMGFNKELTGRENVYLNGMMLGIGKAKIDHFFGEILEFSNLGKFIDRPMKTYSSGMKARLGFSVAAHLEPEILILDEALNTGDRAFSQKASKKIRELLKQAKMVIIVTHSHRYAKNNCDRLIWLEQGEVRAIGDPEEVLNQYEATIPKVNRRPRKRLELTKTESQVKDKKVVSVKDITIKFNMRRKSEHIALNKLNFNISEGEAVGIIGHNGAGKSTLCKVLTKILKPDEGEVMINGETTALLSYGTGFNQQLSGLDNIYLNGLLLGLSKAVVDKHVDDIVEFSELGNKIQNPIKQYSSGMRARLGFSIAAMLKPDIFIIDEALSTGDVAFQQKASEKIQDMMEQAKAVIIVSHSMSFVEKVCTRAIWIEEGQIRQDGEAEEVVAAYRTATNRSNPKIKRNKKQVVKQ